MGTDGTRSDGTGSGGLIETDNDYMMRLMMRPTSCYDCAYVEYSAAIQDALADKLGIPRQPYPTATCLRYGKTRRRDRYRMEPLPECTRDKEWTKNDG